MSRVYSPPSFRQSGQRPGVAIDEGGVFCAGAEAGVVGGPAGRPNNLRIKFIVNREGMRSL